MKKQVNTVDVARGLGIYKTSRAIARDSTGKLWIIYKQESATFANDDTMVAYSTDNGVTWTEEIAVADSFGNPYGNYTIMLDSSDVPHIIYHYTPAAGNEEIRYANRSGGSWSSPETLVSDANSILFINACIDSGNNIHIVWSVHSTYNIQYLTGTSGSWGSAEDVDATDATEEADITIGASSEPYVAFACHTTGANQGIFMRYRTGGTWQAREEISTVDPHSSVSVVIASDGSNNMHVVWTEDISNDLAIKYRKRTSTVWGTAITVVTPDAGYDFNPPILVLDSSSNAYVVYQHKHAATDEAVYWKKITANVAGDEQTLESAAVRPGVAPSTFAGLWQKYPSSSVIAAALCPIVGILKEITNYADLYYYVGGVSTIYPADGITRVTGLIHRYMPGSYTLELMLGDVKTEWGTTMPQSTMPDEVAARLQKALEDRPAKLERFRDLVARREEFPTISEYLAQHPELAKMFPDYQPPTPAVPAPKVTPELGPAQQRIEARRIATEAQKPVSWVERIRRWFGWISWH